MIDPVAAEQVRAVTEAVAAGEIPFLACLVPVAVPAVAQDLVAPPPLAGLAVRLRE